MILIRSRHFVLAISIAAVCPHAVAWEALRFAEYKTTRDSRAVRDYVSGLGNAFDTVNVYLTQNGEAPLFCGPRLSALNVEHYLKAIDEQAKFIHAGGGKVDTLPVETLLLNGLVRLYPCK